jgi:hypothetical protein
MQSRTTFPWCDPDWSHQRIDMQCSENALALAAGLRPDAFFLKRGLQEGLWPGRLRSLSRFLNGGQGVYTPGPKIRKRLKKQTLIGL